MKSAIRCLAILSLLSACAGGDASDPSARQADPEQESNDEDGDGWSLRWEGAPDPNFRRRDEGDDAGDGRSNLGSISEAVCSPGAEPCEDTGVNTLREPIEDGREELGTFTGGAVCRAYRDPDFRGASMTLEPTRVYNSLGTMNDAISSFRLPPSCELVAFQHPDQRGGSVRFFSDVAFVGPKYNDQISSFACACRLDVTF